jgi:SulP family sulfate permease
MTSTGFCDRFGWQNFLTEDLAVSHIFYKHLDPAVCIYECPVKVFKECQNLPKQLYLEDIPILDKEELVEPIIEVKAADLWKEMRSNGNNVYIVDVREPREYHRGHIPEAEMIPLPKILAGQHELDLGSDKKYVFVCRSGRRSRRVARLLMNGHQNIRVLSGGMLAWEAEGLLEGIDY